MTEDEARREGRIQALQQVHLWLRDHAHVQYEKESAEQGKLRPRFSDWAAERLARDHSVWHDGAWSELVHRSRREGAEIALAEARKIPAGEISVDSVLGRLTDVARNVKAYGLNLLRT